MSSSSTTAIASTTTTASSPSSSNEWNQVTSKRHNSKKQSIADSNNNANAGGWQIAGGSQSGSGGSRRDDELLSFTTPFTLWTFSKSQMQSYDTSLKKLCTFSTIPQFWHYYQYLLKPSQMNEHLLEQQRNQMEQRQKDDSSSKQPPFPGRDVQCFREGIKPAWEDPSNRNGGKWMIRIKKEYSNRLWEELLLAFVGEQLTIHVNGKSPQDDVQEVCGIVLSVREHDIISVWNRNAHDHHSRDRLRDRIKNVLHLPVGTVMEYKPHQIAQQKGQNGEYAPQRPHMETYRVTYRDNRRNQRGGGRHYGGGNQFHQKGPIHQ